MTDVTGRSVRLFLVDGKSTGLITAEIMNWTGHVLTGPRSQLPKFLARPEVGRTGVYLLHGRDRPIPMIARLTSGKATDSRVASSSTIKTRRKHSGSASLGSSPAKTRISPMRMCAISKRD